MNSDPQKPEMQFHYKPLANGEIRLLRLPRRDLFGGIKSSLIHVPLDKAPGYECISYVWGDQTKTSSILIDGCQMLVPTSVYNILFERAPIWAPRLLWIDAICINQDDKEEKSIQIRKMGLVYRNVYRVTVCLGSSPDVQLARVLLHKLAVRMGAFQPSEQWKHIGESYGHHRDIEGGSAPREWTALKRLISNPWFERVWVVQEVVMASKVDVLYGGQYLDWDTLISILAEFQKPEATMLRSLIVQIGKNHLSPMPNGVRNGPVMESYRQRFHAGKKMQLHHMLMANLSFKATFLEDKIYAIQGFTEEAEHPDLPIKYGSEITKVLINTSRYFIETLQSLQILQLTGIGWKRGHESIPSWVVDWTMTRPQYVTSYSDLAGPRAAMKAAIQNATKRSPREGKALSHNEWVVFRRN
jgi:hypothetical protein